MNRLLAIIFLFLFLLCISSPIYAGTFQLKSIGAVAVNGASYKHWWIVGSNPRLTGSAMPSSVVNVVIDGTTYSVTSDAQGNWSYTPPTLKDGDHEVSLASGGSSIYFTLTTGTTIPTGIIAPPPATLPISGSVTPLLGLLVGGLALMGIGYRLRRS